MPATVPADTDEMIALMNQGLLAAGVVSEGETVVLVAASPFGKAHTNMLKIHRVGGAVR